MAVTTGEKLKYGNKDVAWDVDHFKQGREAAGPAGCSPIVAHFARKDAININEQNTN